MTGVVACVDFASLVLVVERDDGGTVRLPIPDGHLRRNGGQVATTWRVGDRVSVNAKHRPSRISTRAPLETKEQRS